MYIPVKGFENLYLIYDDGKVWSVSKKKFISQEIMSTGYVRVHLYKNKKKYHKFVHRLVAEAFIPNPNNLPQVNHKDENKTNNCVDNLEWISPIDNTNYGTCIERRSKKYKNNKYTSKPVVQYDLDFNILNIYPSIREAERQTGYANGHISFACKNLNRTVGGSYWRYKE